MNSKNGFMSKKLIIGTVFLGAILSTFLVVNAQISKKAKFFGAPTVEQVKNIGQLAALKVYISDVLEGTGDGVKGAWLIKGDALIGADMTGMTIDIVDAKQKTARIQLATPIVISPRVDHERTKTYDVNKSFFTSKEAESKLRDNAMKEAQRVIAQVANESGNIEKAKERLEELIKNFYTMVNWTVSVEWLDNPPNASVASD